MANPLAPLIEKIQKIPTKTRAIGLGVFVFLILVLFIWQFQIPMKTSIEDLEKALVEQRAKIAENDNKIKKLDELRAEVVYLQKKLVVLTEQLPSGSEVPALLSQIDRLVKQSGLTASTDWKSAGKKLHTSGLYMEIPITLILNGGYHNVAKFFERVGSLTRIVNILNIKMGDMKTNKDGSLAITVNCTAMTFSAAEKK